VGILSPDLGWRCPQWAFQLLHRECSSLKSCITRSPIEPPLTPLLCLLSSVVSRVKLVIWWRLPFPFSSGSHPYRSAGKPAVNTMQTADVTRRQNSIHTVAVVRNMTWHLTHSFRRHAVWLSHSVNHVCCSRRWLQLVTVCWYSQRHGTTYSTSSLRLRLVSLSSDLEVIRVSCALDNIRHVQPYFKPTAAYTCAIEVDVL
jgi:hypothetical protein